MSSQLVKIFMFLGLLSLFGGSWFYIGELTPASLTIAALLSGAGALMAPSPSKEQYRSHRTLYSGVAFLLALALSTGILAYLHPITSATRSLWHLFSPWNIIPLCLAGTIPLLIPRLQHASLSGSIAVLGSALGALLFPLGFGFDPFLHRATMHHIALYGTITPKPFYYLGDYAIELFLRLVLRLPEIPVNAYISAVFAGGVMYVGTSFGFLAYETIALFPFALFTVSTPQALGYLWLLLVLFFSTHPKGLLPAGIFALAGIITHPIAGVPTSIFLLASLLGRRFPRVSYSVSFITQALAIPTLFALRNGITHGTLGISWESFSHLERIPHIGSLLFLGNPLMDTLVFLGANIFFLTAFLAGITFIRERKTPEGHTSTLLFTSGLGSIFGFCILSLAFDFPELITYERTDFALRLLALAHLFFLPLAGRSLNKALVYCTKDSLVGKAYAGGLFFLLLTANIFTAYPRHDAYQRSAAFPVTSADMEMVRRIEENSKGEPYVVLGNQMLSAAALSTYGFFFYPKPDMFAYALPTSGKLYELFLALMKSPSQDLIHEASSVSGISRVYVTVHAYWWNSQNILTELERYATSCFSSQDTSITTCVFVEAQE